MPFIIGAILLSILAAVLLFSGAEAIARQVFLGLTMGEEDLVVPEEEDGHPPDPHSLLRGEGQGFPGSLGSRLILRVIGYIEGRGPWIRRPFWELGLAFARLFVQVGAALDVLMRRPEEVRRRRHMARRLLQELIAAHR